MIQELIHYLNYIKHTWITIIGGDHNLAGRIGGSTVDILEGPVHIIRRQVVMLGGSPFE